MNLVKIHLLAILLLVTSNALAVDPAPPFNLQTGSGWAKLSWVAPTENTDNSLLTDLAGFKIYYGTASGNYEKTIDIPNKDETTYTLSGLSKETWYFVMTAYNTSGIESAYSIEVFKDVLE